MIAIHARIENVGSQDFNLELAVGASDGEIKTAVAQHLDIRPDRLNTYEIDRGPDGNVTVRPQAGYG